MRRRPSLERRPFAPSRVRSYASLSAALPYRARLISAHAGADCRPPSAVPQIAHPERHIAAIRRARSVIIDHPAHPSGIATVTLRHAPAEQHHEPICRLVRYLHAILQVISAVIGDGYLARGSCVGNSAVVATFRDTRQ